MSRALALVAILFVGACTDEYDYTPAEWNEFIMRHIDADLGAPGRWGTDEAETCIGIYSGELAESWAEVLDEEDYLPTERAKLAAAQIEELLDCIEEEGR